jgi:hypothetical protein
MSHRIFDPEKEARYAYIIEWASIKPITTAIAILAAALICFLKHTGFNSIYHYIIFDAAFSAMFLPNVWQAGLKFTAIYIALNALWTVGMWHLANYLCPFLINRM